MLFRSALADFITEFTIPDEEVATNKVERWTIQTDGFQTGYFWPTLQKDAKEFVKKYDKCQRFGNVQHIPFEKLMTIASPRPFAQWGLNIIGTLPQGKRQVKFLLVAIDYFTK